ncbi:spindle pole body component Spc97p [[Candida] railenensis]|uniref:Spindle pole body component n=1 Tax=[Candida] railenensis TaxID=45579 RepID=A0A9P0VZC4_9ASCO|nr:spindle pole body component Spc97p [[Candida] railenensis]
MSFTSGAETEADIVQMLKPNVLRPCVNRPPKGYNNIRPHALINLNDLKIQQGLIIKDLLFVFLGFEGFYVRYSEKFDPNSIDAKIRGPDFKTAKHLDISLKSITKRLVSFGKFYSGLKAFNEYYNSQLSGKVLQKFCFEINRFLQEYEQLVLTIEQEFQLNPNFNLNYLENNILRNSNISIQIDLLYEIALMIHDESVSRHFQAVSNSSAGEEVLEEAGTIGRKDETYFQNFIKTIQNDLRQTGSIDLATDQSNFELCKGGLVLQIIQKLNSEKYLGDAVKNRLLNELFDSISTDYVEMLNGWLSNGEIDDPFDEFLIKENKIKESSLMNKFTEKYWEEVYVTRTDGVIDQFQSRELQLKILATGRYLNIFKMCTGINDTNAMDNDKRHIEITSLSSRDLELKILEFYSRANRLLMKLFFEGYQFPTLMDKLQRTFMLNDSFNIDNFISSSFNDLKRSKYAISESKLQNRFSEIERKSGQDDEREVDETNDEDNNDEVHLESTLTIDYTNFYDLAKEILDVQSFDALKAMASSSSQFKTLLNKSLEKNIPPSSANAGGAGATSGAYDPDHSDEYSISGLNLLVSIQFPLNILIGQNFIFQYQLIFKLLVLTKFISKLSDNTWKEINYSTVWKYRHYDPRIKKWILRSRILLNRMGDFMREMQFYFNLDIIESNYKEITGTMSEIEQELKVSQKTSSTSTKRNHSARDSNVYSDRFNTFNNNSIFDRNIIQHQQIQRNVSSASNSGATSTSGAMIDVNILRTKFSSFLNNILRHSLLTNKDLIDSLKRVYDLIISYSHYLSRLKKSLVLLNAELYNTFRQDYPDKFEGKSVDADSIYDRYVKLNDRLIWYYEVFGDTLTDFMSILRKFGETEDQSLLILIQRLENCYPE